MRVLVNQYSKAGGLDPSSRAPLRPPGESRDLRRRRGTGATRDPGFRRDDGYFCCSFPKISIVCSLPEPGTISPVRSVICSHCACTASGVSASSFAPWVSVT